MFCVIYEFDVIPEKEIVFKKLWHFYTNEIKEKHGGLGSRLHKVVGKENLYVAYAQWPSRELWLDRQPHLKNNPNMENCRSVTVLQELEVEDDLLEK